MFGKGRLQAGSRSAVPVLYLLHRQTGTITGRGEERATLISCRFLLVFGGSTGRYETRNRLASQKPGFLKNARRDNGNLG
jgi:hypothetical protein